VCVVREVECNRVGEERSVRTVVGVDNIEEVGYATRGKVSLGMVSIAPILLKRGSCGQDWTGHIHTPSELN
jgi:hypothetical protein